MKEALPVLGKLEGCQNSGVDLYSIAHALEDSFWLRPDFVLAWIDAELGVRNIWHPGMQKTLLANIYFYLKDVKQFGEFHSWRSKALLGDRDFMQEVVQVHPQLYDTAVGNALEDLFILATALAGSAEYAAEFLFKLHIKEQIKEQDDKIIEILSSVRKQLQPFNTLFECILGSMLSTQTAERAQERCFLASIWEEKPLKG